MATTTPTTTPTETQTPDRRKRGIPTRNPNPNEKPKPKAQVGLNGNLAQQVEHWTENPSVRGSIPRITTKESNA